MMNQQECLKLIEFYKNRDFMWDPKNKNYFNRKKRDNAWIEISSQLNFPVSAVKAKMKALLGSYRSEKSKENKSRVTGSGTDEVYESKWFAYQHFEFMRSRDIPKATLDTASTAVSTYESQEAIDTDNPILDTDTPTRGNNSSQNTPASQEGPSSVSTAPSTSTEQHGTMTPPSAKRSRKDKKAKQEDDTEAIMNSALQVLQSSVNTSTDPYYTYALYLANEMRKYDPQTLASVKRSIANIIYHADMSMIYGSQHQQSTTHDHASSHNTSTSGQSTPSLEGTSSHESGAHLSCLE